MLDYGATCGSLPEWMFARIYESTMAGIASGKYKGFASRDCPIMTIGDYSSTPQTMLGFKK